MKNDIVKLLKIEGKLSDDRYAALSMAYEEEQKVLKIALPEMQNSLGAETEKAENLKQVVERNHLSRAVYVGDTAGDQAAAQAAGLPFVWASYGFGKDLDAGTRIENFSELLNVVV